jgi:hypothetical protein
MYGVLIWSNVMCPLCVSELATAVDAAAPLPLAALLEPQGGGVEGAGESVLQALERIEAQVQGMRTSMELVVSLA